MDAVRELLSAASFAGVALVLANHFMMTQANAIVLAALVFVGVYLGLARLPSG
jgi:hypothetical protein